ncbi:MAG: phosphatidylglycerophosphatase A [Hahellaceae bacterium]|nr:phosphatidylglycerophosphatase A [Hahellaceae bacterium]MCP5210616.1 phosphatidylglycerophosphatase A [Hahellaceae bacterium]
MSHHDQAPVLTFEHLKDPVNFLAFGLGSGLARKAPGTWGTLMGVAVYLPLQMLGLVPYLFVIVAAFIAGIYICDHASRQLGVHDHGGIVWDEFVGFWITMIAAPEGWSWLVLGFILFRLFDIWKPWPISWADRQVEGGMGIMLDDVLAGVWALVCLQVIAYFV